MYFFRAEQRRRSSIGESSEAVGGAPMARRTSITDDIKNTTRSAATWIAERRSSLMGRAARAQSATGLKEALKHVTSTSKPSIGIPITHAAGRLHFEQFMVDMKKNSAIVALSRQVVEKCACGEAEVADLIDFIMVEAWTVLTKRLKGIEESVGALQKELEAARAEVALHRSSAQQALQSLVQQHEERKKDERDRAVIEAAACRTVMAIKNLHSEVSPEEEEEDDEDSELEPEAGLQATLHRPKAGTRKSRQPEAILPDPSRYPRLLSEQQAQPKLRVKQLFARTDDQKSSHGTSHSAASPSHVPFRISEVGRVVSGQKAAASSSHSARVSSA
eukprot:TRINITY_DN29902_c0_g1_i1.p1 TRINITY_DN29902_c0_g1~~TRINITY_DN29902_c0_g1_i1.p1  ORF type:complete len:333 (-),score=70.57 TRINITY_DN29902_c0_g1_i1:75-1073(-)